MIVDPRCNTTDLNITDKTQTKICKDGKQIKMESF